MPDPFDVVLVDHDLATEVELLTDLMVEAGASRSRLTPREIDRALGVA